MEEDGLESDDAAPEPAKRRLGASGLVVGGDALAGAILMSTQSETIGSVMIPESSTTMNPTSVPARLVGTTLNDTCYRFHQSW